MCGIVGIVNCDSSRVPMESAVFDRMRDTMVHRGPDGAGTWVSSDRQVWLGHRRLSIIDLSEDAGQPMCNEDSTIWIVFNGEIYNHMKIRLDLEARGHIFKTNHSDTEVIIHAFEEWGKDCVNEFVGMFAFAIWDDRKKELWFYRDRIGVKPFYYAYQKGRFVFASEIKAILADSNVNRTVNEKALYDYLSFLMTPSPDTIFENIHKLPPGHYGILNSKGHLVISRYWDVLDNTDPLTNISDDEIAERLLSELKTSVGYRKVSDVPVGVFLSGGIDSSTNAVLFSDGETSPIKTFTIGYEGEYKSHQNEFEYARIISRQVGSEHFEKIVTVDDFINCLDKLSYHQDEPVAANVSIATYYVSKLARDNNIKVCQVGEGADELFCGYSTWPKYIRYQKMSEMPMAGVVKRSGLAMLKLAGMEHKIKYEWLRRTANNEPIFWGGAEAFTEGQKVKLLSARLRNKFKDYSSFEALKPVLTRFTEKAWDHSPLNWMSYMELNFRIPELHLMRVDKMSMAASLEARVPFLDHKFVELAMSIPASVRFKDNQLKYILKKAISGLIPDEIIHRKKQGFVMPVSEWFHEKLGDVTARKFVDFNKRTGYFDSSRINEMILSHDSGLWYILNFMVWHEKWIEGREISY